ncbi:hypothetical protein A6D6_02707 [Alcanivorax xiamenensis]|uniref:Uncharacterized protein n=1 Tax=Alcanivorax xiamenensis TaxID=1177156 RepID=A0ABQ6Y6F7_9GAMM|nr:hypothetical protein [Alcanivorax xiamenensis]KAF0804943.1 hypothetical protein A6D6_02707 [Alcanivorax xiamenensis]
MATREERRANAAEIHAQKLAEIAGSPLKFVDRNVIAAVPAVGGVLTDCGLDKAREDLADSAIVPVSERLAAAEKTTPGSARFIVVMIDGHRCAVTPLEAEALGLKEDDTWAWVPAEKS